jgi:hypothetical protein
MRINDAETDIMKKKGWEITAIRNCQFGGQHALKLFIKE